MMCIAHEAEQYGYLTIGGKPMTTPQISRMVGEVPKVVEKLLAELEQAGVFSRDERGAIYSRRMVKDEHLRNVRAEGGKDGAEHGHKGAEYGKMGGRPRKQITPHDNEENPSSSQEEGGGNNPPSIPPLKPSPSSSSSSSSSTSSSTSVGKEDANASSKRRAKVFVAPSREEVRQYFKENGYTEEYADKAFRHYDLGEWKDSNGKAVKNWKQKFATNWFGSEGKALAAAGTVTAENATYAIMQPMPYGKPDRWPIAEYQALKHTTEYKLIGYE